jgi:hypothetical protein
MTRPPRLPVQTGEVWFYFCDDCNECHVYRDQSLIDTFDDFYEMLAKYPSLLEEYDIDKATEAIQGALG